MDEVWVSVLGAVVNYNMSVCDHAVRRDLAYLVIGKDINGVSSGCGGEVVAWAKFPNSLPEARIHVVQRSSSWIVYCIC